MTREKEKVEETNSNQNGAKLVECEKNEEVRMQRNYTMNEKRK